MLGEGGQTGHPQHPEEDNTECCIMYAMLEHPPLVFWQHNSNAKGPVDHDEAAQNKKQTRSRRRRKRRSRRSRVMVALLVQGDWWALARQEVAEQVMAGLA